MNRHISHQLLDDLGADNKRLTDLVEQQTKEITRLKSLPIQAPRYRDGKTHKFGCVTLTEQEEIEPPETELERKAWEFVISENAAGRGFSDFCTQVTYALDRADQFMSIRNARRQEAGK